MIFNVYSAINLYVKIGHIGEGLGFAPPSAGLSSWGALCQTQMGAPVLCHSLVPIPAVPITASR